MYIPPEFVAQFIRKNEQDPSLSRLADRLKIARSSCYAAFQGEPISMQTYIGFINYLEKLRNRTSLEDVSLFLPSDVKLQFRYAAMDGDSNWVLHNCRTQPVYSKGTSAWYSAQQGAQVMRLGDTNQRIPLQEGGPENSLYVRDMETRLWYKSNDVPTIPDAICDAHEKNYEVLDRQPRLMRSTRYMRA